MTQTLATRARPRPWQLAHYFYMTVCYCCTVKYWHSELGVRQLATSQGAPASELHYSVQCPATYCTVGDSLEINQINCRLRALAAAR